MRRNGCPCADTGAMPAPTAAGAIGRACCAVGAGLPDRVSGAAWVFGAAPAGTEPGAGAALCAGGGPLVVAGGSAPPAEVLKVRSARLAAQRAGPAPQAVEFVQPEGLAPDALVLVLEPRAAW